MNDLTEVLTDPTYTRDERLVRLQGWRGAEADQALSSGWAAHAGPAVCAVGSLAAGILRSPLLLAALVVTAMIGAFAPTHPAEATYNYFARKRGAAEVPPTRAARRLGCGLGVLILGTAAVAFLAGATTLAMVLSISFGLLALFVAVTGVCVPSIVFTLLWGSERAKQYSFVDAARTGRHPGAGREPAETPDTGTVATETVSVG